ncbi:hypothetical protein MFMK1_000384 [Metallumcola ferriviriculae]|uniref:Uncharacterized protein n=1 Tax=Metallumcola ferriviriculae TaxID=3039180 RepID=A0AAU0UK98_9FIRM|nr:hypothetical protein MFMK1_000384 [Desulfitibacteraceae bacterium MK1]
MPKKHYDKLKSEASKELTEELVQDIQKDSQAHSKELGNVNSKIPYDQYLNQLSGNHKTSRQQLSGQSQENNFLAEEMEQFGLNSAIEQDEDRGQSSLLENLKTNKTTK